MRPVAIYSAETTVAASGNSTFSDSLMHLCDLHQITLNGSGTATITVTPRVKGSGDASFTVNLGTGKTAGTALYAFSGANSIKITETGGANSITYVINSYSRG